MNPRHEMNICLGWCAFALVACILMLSNGKSAYAAFQAASVFYFAVMALYWARRI